MLKKSKAAYAQDKSVSVGDVESPVDEVPMSPLSIVHVRNDYEVTRDTADASEGDSGSSKPKRIFD